MATVTTKKAMTTFQKYMAKRKRIRRILFLIRFNRYKKAMAAKGLKFSNKVMLKLYKFHARRVRLARIRRMMYYRWKYASRRRSYRKILLRARVRAWLRKRKAMKAKAAAAKKK